MQERNVLSLVVATAWWRGVVIDSVYSDAVGALLLLLLAQQLENSSLRCL